MMSRYQVECILFERVLERIYEFSIEEIQLQKELLRSFSKLGKELKREFSSETDKQMVRDILTEFFDYTSWYNTGRVRGRLRMMIHLCDRTII